MYRFLWGLTWKIDPQTGVKFDARNGGEKIEGQQSTLDFLDPVFAHFGDALFGVSHSPTPQQTDIPDPRLSSSTFWYSD